MPQYKRMYLESVRAMQKQAKPTQAKPTPNLDPDPNPNANPDPTLNPTPKQLIFTEGGYTFLAESNNKKVITPNPSPYPSS